MADVDYRLKMKDLPIYERPYERLEEYGPEMLSNAELLAIIIRTGNRDENSVALAQRVLKQDKSGKGLAFLHDISLEELRNIKGIGRVKAIQIKALAEISKRISSTYNSGKRVAIKSPADVSNYLMEEMRHLKKEVFKVILLNAKGRVIRCIDVSTGSLNVSIVHPREVFSEAVRSGCAGLIFVHNHPSGDPEPSPEDIDITQRLVESGKILGIKVLDHIIIGDGKYISLVEKGLIQDKI